MNVAYVRVSTAEQNEERQIKAISDRCSSVEKWFTEKVSGKSMDRPKLKEMLDYVREGDTVYNVINLKQLLNGKENVWNA